MRNVFQRNKGRIRAQRIQVNINTLHTAVVSCSPKFRLHQRNLVCFLQAVNQYLHVSCTFQHDQVTTIVSTDRKKYRYGVIYKLDCADCGKFYIRETTRPFNVWLKKQSSQGVEEAEPFCGWRTSNTLAIGWKQQR